MTRKPLSLLSLFMSILLSLCWLTGCSRDGETSPSSSDYSVTSSPAIAAIACEYSSEDMDSSWDNASSTQITLQGNSINVRGSGASVAGSVVTITAAGTYVLSGALDNGQIVVFTGKEDVVRLVLNGVQLSCSSSAPIYSRQSQKTILILPEGSHNSIEDGNTYTLPEGDDAPNAAVFCQDDLTINGSGSLTVKGNYNNGIGTKDNLIITGGSIEVAAQNDGLKGRDSIAVNGGIINVNAGGDGLQSNNDEDPNKGWICLDGGVLNIIAGNDGIQAQTTLQINHGEFSLRTGGGSINASTDSSGEIRPGWGKWEDPSPARDTTGTGASEDTVSAKGLKAAGNIIINGGIIDIDSSDDAVHSNSDIFITAGDTTISSGDDGIHADSSLTIDGGSIIIQQCYEGLESASITINGGTIHVKARDDGLNTAGGNDASALGGRAGENGFRSDGSYFIKISAGYLYIDAAGDGIDSNGALYFEGGTVLVNGPTNNGNGALDYQTSCSITGGILVAAGSSGMAQAPGESSTQNSLMIYYSSAQKAGTLAALLDDQGNSILSFAPSKDYQSIVISSPDLAEGKTYALYSGGSCSSQARDGLYQGGALSAATKLTDITISGKVTSISDDGSPVTGGMGRMGAGRDMGGMTRQEGRQPGGQPRER